MLKIQIDDREDSNIINRFKEYADVEVSRLDVGDYMCGVCLVEHKKPLDFVKSVYNGLVFQQCADLLNCDGMHPYILISGKIRDFEYYGYNSSDIIDAISSLNCRGVPTFCVESEDFFIDYALSLFRKHNDGKIRTVCPQRKPVSYGDMVSVNYSTIPKIGMKMAIKLKKVFTTPKKLYNVTKEQLMQIEGISDNRADAIIQFINGEYTNENQVAESV